MVWGHLSMKYIPFFHSHHHLQSGEEIFHIFFLHVCESSRTSYDSIASGGKTAGCCNLLWKRPLSVTIRAIPGSNNSTQVNLFDSALPSLPRMAPTAMGVGEATYIVLWGTYNPCNLLPLLAMLLASLRHPLNYNRSFPVRWMLMYLTFCYLVFTFVKF